MSFYFLKERDALEHSKKNAGSKARNDVEAIATALGYAPLDVELPYKPSSSLAASIHDNVRIYAFFKEKLSVLQKGDSLLVQFPPRSHSVLFPRLYQKLRRKGVHVTFLIHDLERMRYIHLTDVSFKKRVRILLEESLLLKQADVIICHNEKMKQFLVGQGIASDKLVPLGIFDYLTDAVPDPMPVDRPEDQVGNRVIIAGNLSPEKCVYLTQLQEVPDVQFQLYGVGFEDRGQENVDYKGSFLPEELVSALEGDFGLVWDGTSVDTCTGIFGNYLRLNDPHKLSLYLTAGLPVIVWSEAAVADFVKEHNVGLAVASLKDLPGALKQLSPAEYHTMAANASALSNKLRDGHYLKTALGF
ncbi:MAG: sugar transferase [Clostridia bacterium]|nr:sugar transferase [Clostridia bacterium]